jgi:hypothetical protein
MTTDELNDANSFLMGSSVTSAKFEAIGDTVTGVIEDAQKRQQADFATNKPLFWDDGNPRMQVVITLQTDEQTHEGDDGRRRIYVKGQMQQALQEAIKASGLRGITIGDQLAVRYVGDGEAKPRQNPPKLYKVFYKAAPPRTVVVDDPFQGTPHPADDPAYEPQPDETPF